MKLENKAWLLARQYHEGQKDDDGNDYFEAHILPVARVLRALGCSDEVVSAGFLHDTLEDTKLTYEMIWSICGKRVADLVLQVTHDGKADNKGFYFPRLGTKDSDRDAVLIKFADRMSNLVRMGSWDIARREHYLRKSRFWKVSADDKTR